MAYSSGFHPHPRISYAGASPTGAASEAEYLELGLAERRDPEDVRRALDDALPDGLDVAAIVESPGGSLADLLVASAWLVELRGADPAAGDGGGRGLPRHRVGAGGADDQEGPADLRLPRGRRRLDVTDAEGEPALALVLRHTVPAVRPDDVLSGLAEVSGFTPPTTALLTRIAQGPLDETTGSVGDPLG